MKSAGMLFVWCAVQLLLALSLYGSEPPVEANGAGQKVLSAVSLFDGNTFAGWEGNTNVFRVEAGAIVGGNLKNPIVRNEFLCTLREYSDFELRLKFRVLGKDPNAGVQIRSRRIANNHEMIGYQADIGQSYWGSLYDESRRRKVLVGPAQDVLRKALKGDDWNDYVIRCEGKRIRMWLNGYLTVDYTEPDDKIEQKGLIGLQIHGGQPAEARYKDITIAELPGPGTKVAGDR